MNSRFIHQLVTIEATDLKIKWRVPCPSLWLNGNQMEQTPVRNIWLLRKQFLAWKIHFQIKSHWTLQAQIYNINTRKGPLYSLPLLPLCWGQGFSGQVGPSFYPGHCLTVGGDRDHFWLCPDFPRCPPRSAWPPESSQTQLKKNLERQSRLSSLSPRMSNMESEPTWQQLLTLSLFSLRAEPTGQRMRPSNERGRYTACLEVMERTHWSRGRECLMAF